jgi:hypothetical protein
MRGSSVAVTISQSISGLPYPATKQKIIEYVRNKGGDTSVQDVITKIPEQIYNNESELRAAINNTLE